MVSVGEASLNLAARKVASPTAVAASRAAVWLLLAAIRFYQAIFAPVMPLGCKFYPSCSRYAAEAIERHGAIRGARLALARLWRCRPFTEGGVDPVPDPDELSTREVRS
jgi:putative membrane protein insertion efficiency factor